MKVDPRDFHRLNVTDTCAVWNVLSSQLLFETAICGSCQFCCTGFVDYECIVKPRNRETAASRELQSRLRTARRDRGQFKVYPISVDDLLELDVLERRQRLSKGELSSLVFAKLTGQAFLTDDQAARTLAAAVLPKPAQTTPHLLGWLVYCGAILPKHRDGLLDEHRRLERPLAKYLDEVFELALYYRTLGSRSHGDSASGP